MISRNEKKNISIPLPNLSVLVLVLKRQALWLLAHAEAIRIDTEVDKPLQVEDLERREKLFKIRSEQQFWEYDQEYKPTLKKISHTVFGLHRIPCDEHSNELYARGRLRMPNSTRINGGWSMRPRLLTDKALNLVGSKALAPRRKEKKTKQTSGFRAFRKSAPSSYPMWSQTTVKAPKRTIAKSKVTETFWVLEVWSNCFCSALLIAKLLMALLQNLHQQNKRAQTIVLISSHKLHMVE